MKTEGVDSGTEVKCVECEALGNIFEIDSSKSKVQGHSLTQTGKIILGITGALFVGVYAVTVPFIAPALRKYCLPFVPATHEQVRNVFEALRGRSGTLLDIGSGDGRIVIEAAKKGFKSTGVELNPWLVLYSKWNAWKMGVRSSAAFTRQDLWKTNLGTYDNIVIFGVEQMMEQLEHKLDTEVNSKTRIVACRFPFPNWEPVLTVGEGIDTVWLYRVNNVSAMNKTTNVLS